MFDYKVNFDNKSSVILISKAITWTDAYRRQAITKTKNDQAHIYITLPQWVQKSSYNIDSHFVSIFLVLLK